MGFRFLVPFFYQNDLRSHSVLIPPLRRNIFDISTLVSMTVSVSNHVLSLYRLEERRRTEGQRTVTEGNHLRWTLIDRSSGLTTSDVFSPRTPCLLFLTFTLTTHGSLLLFLFTDNAIKWYSVILQIKWSYRTSLPVLSRLVSLFSKLSLLTIKILQQGGTLIVLLQISVGLPFYSLDSRPF